MKDSTKTTLFRSEEMSLVQLFIPAEIAHACIAELGELGKVQFRDLNSNVNAFQRIFVPEIRRLDEMERQCRYLQSQIEKLGIPIISVSSDKFVTAAHTAQEIDDLEELLNNHERHIIQMNSSYETLLHRFLQLTELRYVLKESSIFFEQAGLRHVQQQRHHQSEETTVQLLVADDIEDGQQSTTGHIENLGYVAGTIPREKMQIFERVLWRILRGNLYMNFAEINDIIIDPLDTEKKIRKNVFVIFAHGQEVINKIKKISESMGGTLYNVDEEHDKRCEAFDQVTTRIRDLNIVLSQTQETRKNELLNVADHLAVWYTIVLKEKGVYHIMNLFNYDLNRKCLIAEGWCSKLDIPIVHLALKNAIEDSGTNMPSVFTELSQNNQRPPTYHRTNKFTEGFQTIIDAYGIARYREVNPGLFTLISFPFLFAIMFGDIGHGFLIFCFALYLILNEKRLANVKDEIFTMFFSGRYMILLMGLFSIFTGFIYNDMFSLSLHSFKSGFDWPSHYTSTDSIEATPNGHIYPFGIDPAWHGSENYLLFSNSYKMKQAIILGVIHMSFAICLNVYNHIYYGNRMFIWLEFLPQILFMESIFGYLIFCIMYKWSVNWWELDTDGHLIHNPPPNLLNMLIYMFLSPGKVKPEDQLYPHQGPVQLILILLAVICVPWMWFAKPFYLKQRHHDQQALEENMQYPAETSNTPTIVNEDNVEKSEEKFEFSEEMIHQTIHVIEFCLNCISNTASYLRLWALSLAHAQLSSVLWDMTLKIWFNFTGPIAVIGIVIGFSMWFVLTIGILLCMEGLSAFLHALRLHWVEFDGKFYMGDGVKFEPFSFKTLIDNK
ncbi:V-type ATPase, V0 complex, 116kDa subunit family [Cokeromyces recurvatus]|uniref:V-type ATPase, V0 complex, 116kDa subunit family n=1 Tax=Cokeromyces recurvatus TaxID=90255 RepID=UPI00221F4746|nr:V-type ATPase, V0 complex, 116kDa subunit family [Cokeromyces recurvatus]KAI7904283.1 V-type ATPase, V0 complex, 116kDa subunit family [Cokeromyces recurvatus]